MAYLMGGDAPRARRDYAYDDAPRGYYGDAPRPRRERVTYEEERVVRRVSGPRGYVQSYADYEDRPVRVKVEKDEEKPPNYVEKTARNGAVAIATILGVGGMVAFFYGGFAAIGGSHGIPIIGRLPTLGIPPVALALGGIAAMGAGGILNHFAKPKK